MTESPKHLQKRLRRERQARLQAERLLEEKSDELYEFLEQARSSERLLRSILRGMAEGLLVLNQDLEVVLLNDQLKALYPGEADALEPRMKLAGCFSQLLGHPEFKALMNRETREVSFEIDNSADRTILVSARRTGDGHVNTTHLDITARLAAEEERRKLLMNLMRAQRLESIGRMSGMIAHDFNNIIASIKGFAGFLAEDLAHAPDLVRSVQSIETAAHRAENLIVQIIEYSRQQSSLHHEVSLTPVIDDCIDLLAPNLPEGIEVKFEEPEETIWIKGNETQLGQVFTNLLTNALAAMAETPGSITVQVGQYPTCELGDVQPSHPRFAASEGCSVSMGASRFDWPCARVVIQDSGHGMTPEVLSRVFDFHFTTRDGGGGVGLTSVASIVEGHEGGIRITSVPNLGTTVEVIVPCAVQPEFRTAPGNYEPEGAISSADVLLVDDDTSVGEMQKVMMEREGITVTYLSDPLRAMRELLDDPARWRLVISDQIMPGITGSQILAHLRERGIGIPFMICTAHGGSVDSLLQQQLGDDYLVKPVAKDRLLAKVRQHLRAEPAPDA